MVGPLTSVGLGGAPWGVRGIGVAGAANNINRISNILFVASSDKL